MSMICENFPTHFPVFIHSLSRCMYASDICGSFRSHIIEICMEIRTCWAAKLSEEENAEKNFNESSNFPLSKLYPLSRIFSRRENFSLHQTFPRCLRKLLRLLGERTTVAAHHHISLRENVREQNFPYLLHPEPVESQFFSAIRSENFSIAVSMNFRSVKKIGKKGEKGKEKRSFGIAEKQWQVRKMEICG